MSEDADCLGMARPEPGGPRIQKDDLLETLVRSRVLLDLEIAIPADMNGRGPNHLRILMYTIRKE
jgi:hypothetical protein